jgi:hypothetical protein
VIKIAARQMRSQNSDATLASLRAECDPVRGDRMADLLPLRKQVFDMELAPLPRSLQLPERSPAPDHHSTRMATATS